LQQAANYVVDDDDGCLKRAFGLPKSNLASDVICGLPENAYRHVSRRIDARFALRSRSHPPHGIAEIIRNEQATDFINRESYRPASRLVV
jgi:hypothetical protein